MAAIFFFRLSAALISTPAALYVSLILRLQGVSVDYESGYLPNHLPRPAAAASGATAIHRVMVISIAWA